MKNILIICSLIFFLSCSKKDQDNHTIVKGIITNTNNHIPIEGFSLNIIETEFEWFSWSSTYAILTTDSAGQFDFSFDAKENYFYRLISVDNNDFNEIIPKSIEIGKLNEFDIEISSKEKKIRD